MDPRDEENVQKNVHFFLHADSTIEQTPCELVMLILEERGNRQ